MRVLFFRWVAFLVTILWISPCLAVEGFSSPWKERLENDKPDKVLRSDEVGWQEVVGNKPPQGFNQTVWIKNQLPQNIEHGQALYFVNGLEDIQVYIEGQLVYSHGSFEKDWLKMTSQHWHLIPLKPEWSSKTVSVRLHYALGMLTLTYLPKIVDYASQLEERASASLVSNAMAGVFLALGCIAALVAITRKKFDSFFYFACVGISAGIWMTFNAHATLKHHIPIDASWWPLLEVFSLLLGVSAFFSFLRDISQWPSKIASVIEFGPWFALGLATSAWMFRLAHPWYFIPVMHVATLLTMTTFLPRTVYIGLKSKGEARVFSIGCSVLVVSGIHDIMVFSGSFTPLVASMIPFGVAAIFVSMGSILTMRYSEERKEAIRVREKMIEEIDKEVKIKTRDIKSLLDYVPQGILSVVENGVIAKDYSDHLKLVLEKDDFVSRSFKEVILDNCDLSTDKMDQSWQSILAIIGESEFSFDANADKLPDELVYVSATIKKVLKVTWNAVLKDDSVERLLVTLLDVTNEKQLELEAQVQRREMLMLQQLVQIPSDKVHQLFASASVLFEESRKILDKSELTNTDLRKLFVNAHTIKGAARSLQLQYLSDVIHSMEESYNNILVMNEKLELQQLKEELAKTLSVLAEYVSINDDKLNRKKDENAISIDRSFILNQYRLMHSDTGASSIAIEDLVRELKEQSEELIKLAFDWLPEVIASYENRISSVASDLGKPAPIIDINVNQIPLTEDFRTILDHCLIHIFRNAIDHGIESPTERLTKGKLERGTIFVESDLSDDYLNLYIYDDGRGLAIGRLKDKFLEKKPNEDPSLTAVAEMIFDSGVSTADKLSQISGRGVGMDAVRTYVERAGGSVELRFVSNVEMDAKFIPFKIHIRLPYDQSKLPLAA